MYTYAMTVNNILLLNFQQSRFLLCISVIAVILTGLNLAPQDWIVEEIKVVRVEVAVQDERVASAEYVYLILRLHRQQCPYSSIV